MNINEIEVVEAVILGRDVLQEREDLISDYMMKGGFSEADAIKAAEATLLEDMKII